MTTIARIAIWERKCDFEWLDIFRATGICHDLRNVGEKLVLATTLSLICGSWGEESTLFLGPGFVLKFRRTPKRKTAPWEFYRSTGQNLFWTRANFRVGRILLRHGVVVLSLFPTSSVKVV